MNAEVAPSVLPPELAEMPFDNRFLEALPGDDEAENYRRQVANACWSAVAPTPVAEPKVVAVSPEAAALLDLPDRVCESEAFAAIFAGNQLAPGMEPYATCYGGHQFGNWAGQLGDGRAINLGEIVNRKGERWALQLKGAGPTPYSRTADGLAVLRSSLREFLCSEAMFHLGVPTTRALSLILTGEEVVRDILYDGHPAPEPGSVVCRLAPSFTRFGHFEMLAARRETELLRRFADFTIDTDFQELESPSEGPDRYLGWFAEVVSRTAHMVAEWMRVGFVHGVMNTDNMSILGLTIDYGPYGWLEDYDPGWTPNTTDAATRRYRYGQQPAIAQWNLVQLANAIYPLVGDAKPLEEALAIYAKEYTARWQEVLASKLGLVALDPAGDAALVKEMFALLQAVETDMTIFYRRLADVDLATCEPTPLEDAWYVPTQATPALRDRLQGWLSLYASRARQDAVSLAERRARMNSVNPKYVLRNYIAQLAIDKAETGDFTLVRELLDVLRHPYNDQPEREEYAKKRPDWARNRPGCSMLSCSS